MAGKQMSVFIGRFYQAKSAFHGIKRLLRESDTANAQTLAAMTERDLRLLAMIGHFEAIPQPLRMTTIKTWRSPFLSFGLAPRHGTGLSWVANHDHRVHVKKGAHCVENGLIHVEPILKHAVHLPGYASFGSKSEPDTSHPITHESIRNDPSLPTPLAAMSLILSVLMLCAPAHRPVQDRQRVGVVVARHRALRRMLDVRGSERDFLQRDAARSGHIRNQGLEQSIRQEGETDDTRSPTPSGSRSAAGVGHPEGMYRWNQFSALIPFRARPGAGRTTTPSIWTSAGS